MKAIKPMSLGLLHKPYRYQGRDRLVIVAIGFFRLGAETCDFLPEHQGWPQIVGRIPDEQVLDMVMPKPRGEVLAAANAHALQPVNQMSVRLQVGTVDKRLSIIGDRQWFYGTLPLHGITDAESFEVMPIDYSRAYGGPGHKGNPLGRAHTGRRFGYPLKGNHGAMPNVEYPDRDVTDHYRQSPPAGFGPLDIRWEPRSRMGGTYDARWAEEVAPGLPQDIDWNLFNSAPADQQLDGYFAGGERYRLEGMHPEKRVLEGQLPDIRLRAFLQRRGESAASALEVAMVFDTVWFFPDAEIGVALYRGEAGILESDAADAHALLLAYENNRDAPRPAEHYRQALALRLGAGREAIVHLMNEAPLKPLPNAAAMIRRHAEQQQAEQDHLANSQALIDAAVAEIAESGGLPENFQPPKASLPAFGVLPKAAMARGEADLSELFAKIDARVAQVQAEGAARLSDLRTQINELHDAAGGTGGDDSPDDVDAALARAGGASMSGMAQMMQSCTDPGSSAAQDMENTAQRLSQLDREGRRAAVKPVPKPLSGRAAQALGKEVRRLLLAGESLAGRDLAGAALAGIKLSGADLREVMLERADLSGADLSGADLSGAVLSGADLTGACLDDACLDNASLNGARGIGASFKRVRAKRLLAFDCCLAKADLSGAKLESIVSHRADFSEACLDHAEMISPLLLQLRAPDSSWRAASLTKAILIRADLSRARMEGARLQRCVFAQAAAGMIKLHHAILENCFFVGADLQGGELIEANASSSSWRQCKLDESSLTGASFDQCDFGEASLERSNLRGSRLVRSILSRTRLAGCDATDMELFQSQCRMADFSEAELNGARFMQADLSEARFEKARIRDARHLPEKAKREARP